MTIKEENLKRLARTSIPMNFVKKNEASWDHCAWIEFCTLLEEKGYTPIDLDQVGLLLEKKKEAFLSSK